jgi:hypothetical protein
MSRDSLLAPVFKSCIHFRDERLGSHYEAFPKSPHYADVGNGHCIESSDVTQTYSPVCRVKFGNYVCIQST